MAGDTNRVHIFVSSNRSLIKSFWKVSQTIATMNFMYGAPFEVVFATIFLYQLLGFSAFAGFLVLVAGWPLNNIVARRSIQIQKGVLAARDKQMSVLNELIGAVKFNQFFAWEEHWIKRALDLTVVTGPTASGKTALFLSILGELTLLSGRIIMSKKPSRIDEHGLMHCISYAAQTPWLRHQSIKENILFGYPYDEDRYNAVVECCALKPDLEILEDDFRADIFYNGVNLSGGQKARVALARAIYARTKYVLLDDPLSAVDSHTSRFLYEHLLCGPLLANRTVVLVIHHIDLVLPGAYYLVRILDGRIDTQGTVKDLRAKGALEGAEQDASIDAYKEKEGASEEPSIDETMPEALKSASAIKKPWKLVKDEHREVGGVKWSIHKSYLKASSYWTWVFLTILIVIIQFLSISEKLWIKTWGEAYRVNGIKPLPSAYTFNAFASQERSSMNEYSLHHLHLSTYQTIPTTKGILDINWPNAGEHPLFYTSIYSAIGLASALASVLSVTAQYTGALRASRLLFRYASAITVTVVRATFRFHDTTPTGRLLNCFGKDVETIDSSLAGSLQTVNSSLAGFFAAVITVIVVFPAFLVPAFFIGFAYRELAIGYLNTGHDLRRMEANTRSPIFSDFGELLEGIVTVRAFSAERRFLNNLHIKIDTTTKILTRTSLFSACDTLTTDKLSQDVVFVLDDKSLASPQFAGLAGLCITSAMTFTSSVYWVCRYWTALELDFNSVERVVEYLNLPQEPPAVIESNHIPAYWPSSSNNDSLISVETGNQIRA
ncbi:hypothetical protein BDN70DRAFT_939094 [Pholiota conissans]|uniref:Uncharacterized protein n=1 Tax=Pholiota conissans TaxID=109636 RepID=A0A9P5YLC0_9AGAR|nr:hypothetical protein BDN70DRAFT_939094 [Pholiota conissans]